MYPKYNGYYMVGGNRTLNDFSIRPKLTTATNYVTTIKKGKLNKYYYKLLSYLILYYASLA